MPSPLKPSGCSSPAPRLADLLGLRAMSFLCPFTKRPLKPGNLSEGPKATMWAEALPAGPGGAHRPQFPVCTGQVMNDPFSSTGTKEARECHRVTVTWVSAPKEFQTSFLFLKQTSPPEPRLPSAPPPAPSGSRWAGLTQRTVRLPLASPPPLPGRLDPGAVRLPFPLEELLPDAGLRALHQRGRNRELSGGTSAGPRAAVLFSCEQNTCYVLILQLENQFHFQTFFPGSHSYRPRLSPNITLGSVILQARKRARSTGMEQISLEFGSGSAYALRSSPHGALRCSERRLRAPESAPESAWSTVWAGAARL